MINVQFTFVFVSGCDMTYTSETGKIMSPAYSKNNQRNMTCKYLINVSKPGHVIKIYFRKFDVQYSLECKDESVSVFDGQTVNDTLLGIYCGSAKPAFLRSSSDKILIVFKSSAIADTKGFQLSYRTGNKFYFVLKHYHI